MFSIALTVICYGNYSIAFYLKDIQIIFNVHYFVIRKFEQNVKHLWAKYGVEVISIHIVI